MKRVWLEKIRRVRLVAVPLILAAVLIFPDALKAAPSAQSDEVFRRQAEEILQASHKYEARDALHGIRALEAELGRLPKDGSADRKRLDIYLELCDLYDMAKEYGKVLSSALEAKRLADVIGLREQAHLAQGYITLGKLSMPDRTADSLMKEMIKTADWLSEHGSPKSQIEIYRIQAILAGCCSGEWLPAIAYLNKAEALAQAHHDDKQLAKLYIVRAYLLVSIGSSRDAMEAYANYFRMAGRLDDYVDVYSPLYYLATAFGTTGEKELAHRYWARVREFIEKNKIVQYRFFLFYGEMISAFQEMNDEKVISFANQALAYSSYAPKRIFPVRVHRAISLARLGRVKEAEAELAYLKKTIAAGKVTAPYVILESEIPHIEALIRAAKGDAKGAIRDLERARLIMQSEENRRNDVSRASMEAIYENALLREAAAAAEREIAHQRTMLAVAVAMVGVLFATAVVLVLMNRKIRALAEAKMRLLVNVSHEVRTPLNGILGSLALAKESRDGEEQKHFLDVAKGSAEMLLTIVNDVLDYARIERRMVDLRLQPMHLRSAMRQVMDLMESSAREKALDLQFDYHGPDNLWVISDEVRLRQILHNLLHNAIKFTDRGYVRLSVQTGVSKESGTAETVFTVSDTGIGMSEQDLEEVFMRFHQAHHRDHRNRGGTGLGLSIVRDLTRYLGGAVEVASVRGEGTVFTIKLPFKIAEEPDIKKEESAIEPPQNRSLNVLIAEDNPVNQALLTRMVLGFGHNAKIVANGRDAVSYIERNNDISHVNGTCIDVVLMDVLMPVLDGVDATREIRALKDILQPKIIALTANAFKQQEEACLNAGMDGFLTKPLTKEALQAKLTQTVARAELEKEAT